MIVNGGQDLVLAPETGQDGNTSQRQGAQCEKYGGEGHHPAKAAQTADIQFLCAVLHAARSQEQQGLGKAVGQQVEDGRRIAKSTQGQHH